MLLGTFPVDFFVEIVLQESVFLKLDKCLLISNSFDRFSMVRTDDCQNQKLIFDDDVSECQSKLI